MNIGAAAKLACSYWRRRPQHASGMHVLWSMRRRKHCTPITYSKWQCVTHTHDDMEWKSVARSIDLCSQYRTLPSIGCVLARPSMHASGAVNYSAQQSNMLIWNGRIALASPNRPFMTTPRWIDDHRCIACGCSYFCCFVPPTSSGRCYTSHLIMGAH